MNKKEFEKLSEIVRVLNSLVEGCVDLLCYIDEEVVFREELSSFAREWLKSVEEVCEEAVLRLGRVANRSVEFLVTPRRPWRAGEDSEVVSCYFCGEVKDRRLVVRRWEGEEEQILCLRCAGAEKSL